MRLLILMLEVATRVLKVLIVTVALAFAADIAEEIAVV